MASVPEGDDKPAKYPIAFSTADCVVLNKIDFLSVAEFSCQRFREYVSRARPKAPLLEISYRTGEGLERWMEWLFESVPAKTPEPVPEEKS